MTIAVKTHPFVFLISYLRRKFALGEIPRKLQIRAWGFSQDVVVVRATQCDQIWRNFANSGNCL